MVDTLTGLPGRKELDDRLKQALSAHDSVALAALDIDYFMEVNTECGSATGDKLLQTLAKMLDEEAPGAAYRISGDEFTFLLPSLSLEQVFLRMEALRARIEAAKDTFGLPNGRSVTVTIGVAEYPRDAKDARGLLSAADAALGAAKEGGRNQVSLPANEEMIMKSCYYPESSVNKLRALAKRLNRKESRLLREALDDLIRKYDTQFE